MNLEQIEKRLAEIKQELETDGADIDALSAEVDSLHAKRAELKAQVEKRQATLDKLADGTIGTVVKDLRNGGKDNMELTVENYLESKEYRSAFLKNLQGKELTKEERSALALSGADPVIPTNMQKDILTKAKEYAPILNDITLLNVEGAVKFAVEGEISEADVHTENTTITASENTLVTVALSTYEITKLVQISASVKTMSVDSFETWLTDMLVEAIAMKVEKLIFKGTGSNQAKGIDSTTWNTGNSVTVGATASLTSKDVYALFALLKSGYARMAKIYMNRYTLFNDFMPLMDNAKHNLVVERNGEYFVLGTKVELTDTASNGEAWLGAPEKYVANLAEAIHVVSQYDINTNSNKYLGVAQFDGKLAINESFVKLVKATA